MIERIGYARVERSFEEEFNLFPNKDINGKVEYSAGIIPKTAEEKTLEDWYDRLGVWWERKSLKGF